MIVTLSTPVGDCLQCEKDIEHNQDLDWALQDMSAEFRRTYNGAYLLGGCTITIERPC